MSTWRQKAIECAPELRTEFQARDLTPFDVFGELLPVTRQAHTDKDNERLKKIYSFAAWSLHQKEKDLWNAAGVSFYEHLVDANETFDQFTVWVTKDIYHQVKGLIELRADEEQMKILGRFYGSTGKTSTQ